MRQQKKNERLVYGVYRFFPGVRRMIIEAYLKGQQEGLQAGRMSGYFTALANEGVEMRSFSDVMLDCDPQEAEFLCQDYLTQEGEE